MLSKVVLACLVVYAAAQVEQYPPHPYSFSYDTTDETGARISQTESGDESNSKTGSYSYQTPDGVYRTVNYVADAGGFRATIDTNEPGTKSENPADVQVNANPIEVKETAHAVVAHAPVAVHAVHAPVAVHAVHAVPVVAHAPLTYTLGRARS